MIAITASYYDGKTSERMEVQIQFYRLGQLRITGLENDLTYALSEVRVSPRLGNTPRSIYLPGGAKCETLDNDWIDSILEFQGLGRWQAFQYKLESRLRYVFPLLVLTILGVWGLIDYGIPALAKRVAHALPRSVVTTLGRDGLRQLDRVLFSASELEKEQQVQLLSLFNDITEELVNEHYLQLEFRKSDRAGANAFTLPSGIIVITDDLVLLAQDQNELIGVLTHEMGHVKHRHILRSLLQSSAVVLLIASITGDITSITALSAALPTILLEAKYSRAFETEADQFALQYFLQHNIQPNYFTDILLRLEKKTGNENKTHNYLASHPATSQRVEMFKGNR